MNPPQHTAFGDVPTENQFAALSQALRQSGGIALGDDLARLLDDHRLGDFVGLARLVAHHGIFGFEHLGAFWVPMFQFDLRDLSLTSGAAPVVVELSKVLDGWALAAWFAWPNPCLDQWRPVDALEVAPAKVLSAARITRAAYL